MSTATKIESSVSNFEQDSRDLHVYPKMRVVAALDSSRVALTTLALAASIAVLGLSADSLAVYNRTHVSSGFFLALWPRNFDIRPTNALIATSTIVVLANLASLAVSKTSSLRHRAGIHMSVNMAAPLVAFIVSLIAMAFFYGVNASSNYTFQSWTCRWRNVPMQMEPHFESLCQQSQVGLGLLVMLVPLEAIVLGVAAYQIVTERKIDSQIGSQGRKAASPSLS